MEMIIGKLLYALVGKNMLLSTNKGRWTTYSINTAYRQGVTENSRSKRQGVIRKRDYWPYYSFLSRTSYTARNSRRIRFF